MPSRDNIVRFKKPFDAYEHCKAETYEWHPLWQAALKSSDLPKLRLLAERFRHRVLAVFPKVAYSGSWASMNANFAYRLSELSEFESPLQHMTEARTLYEEVLPSAAPEWHHSMRANHQHCLAEILLRFAEVSGDRSALLAAEATCEQIAATHESERERYLATLGAIRRRIAEHNPGAVACDAALNALAGINTNEDEENGSQSWALHRRSLAAVLLLRHRLGLEADLNAALRAADGAVANYQINPHDFWIRPSAREDAIMLQRELQKLCGGATR